jgi:hypothetical protein
VSKKYRLPESKRIKPWIDKTPREFQLDKVRDMRVLLRAVRDSRPGVAYLEPLEARRAWQQLSDAAYRLQSALKIRRF